MSGKTQATGGAAGASQQGTEGDETEPQYLTAEEFNAAFTKRAKELESRFTKLVAGLETKFGEVATTLGTTLDEKLAALAPKAGDAQQQQAAGSKPEDSPAFKGLQKQLDDLRSKNEAQNAALAAEKAKARAADLRTQALSLLEQNGFTDAARARKQLTLLIAEGRIKWSGDKEDGDELVFVGDDGAVDIETGLKSYAKSEDAKIFLPPKGVAGAGSRPGGAGTKPGEKQGIGSLLGQFFDEQ